MDFQRPSGRLLSDGKSTPELHPSVRVGFGAVITGDCLIGRDSSVWYNCVIRADVGPVRIGAETNIQDLVLIHQTRGQSGTHIGDGVNVGHCAVLHECVLEDGSFVGMQAVVLDGATIQKDAMLAAGSLLSPNKTIPSGELWVGRPAKKMRDLTPDDIRGFAANAKHYVQLARSVLPLLGSGPREPRC